MITKKIIMVVYVSMVCVCINLRANDILKNVQDKLAKDETKDNPLVEKQARYPEIQKNSISNLELTEYGKRQRNIERMIDACLNNKISEFHALLKVTPNPWIELICTIEYRLTYDNKHVVELEGLKQKFEYDQQSVKIEMENKRNNQLGWYQHKPAIAGIAMAASCIGGIGGWLLKKIRD